ncbi:MAG: hypothetical protein GY724_21285 [Actinomycetia bacterium]|nr:hypothetical protein [Actinomycetes bacterium]
MTELAILRIGTRTAIHVPGIEQVAGPYRVLSATGRLAFYIAVVLLGVLLGYVALGLYRRRQSHIAACVVSFVVIAAMGGLGLVTSDSTAVAVTIIVFALTLAASRRQVPLIALTMGLFAGAYLVGATPVILQSAGQIATSDGVQELRWLAELLAMLAGVSSGPLVRRGIGLGWIPSRRLALAGAGVGLVASSALLASPSTTHILMLWNFGLTGTLPAVLYGLAVASFFIAIVSSLRNGEHVLALAMVLFALGGVGLTSTYQSGLVIVALGLVNLDAIPPPIPTPIDAADPGEGAQPSRSRV